MGKLKRRQLCFFFACMAPVGKLLNIPAILSSQTGNGLIFSALLSFSLQLIILYSLLRLSEKTNLSFFDLVENSFGKVVKVIFCILFALYFIWSALYPLLEQKSFVQYSFYDTMPAIIVFLPFFLFSVFACSKNITAIGRSADLSLPIFSLCFFAICSLALLSGDFSSLLPFSNTPFTKIAKGSLTTLNWFSDTAYLLLFLGHFKGNKKTTRSVMISYAIGAFLVLFFLALFYAIFQDVAGRQNFAIIKIAKYNRAIATLGRIDFLFVYALTIVLIFYSVIPLQLAVQSLTQAFGEHRVWFSLGINLLTLILLLFFNYRTQILYSLAGEKLFFIFLLFADLIPLCAWFLRRKKHA